MTLEDSVITKLNNLFLKYDCFTETHDNQNTYGGHHNNESKTNTNRIAPEHQLHQQHNHNYKRVPRVPHNTIKNARVDSNRGLLNKLSPNNKKNIWAKIERNLNTDHYKSITNDILDSVTINIAYADILIEFLQNIHKKHDIGSIIQNYVINVCGLINDDSVIEDISNNIDPSKEYDSFCTQTKKRTHIFAMVSFTLAIHRVFTVVDIWICEIIKEKIMNIKEHHATGYVDTFCEICVVCKMKEFLRGAECHHLHNRVSNRVRILYFQ